MMLSSFCPHLATRPTMSVPLLSSLTTAPPEPALTHTVLRGRTRPASPPTQQASCLLPRCGTEHGRVHTAGFPPVRARAHFTAFFKRNRNRLPQQKPALNTELLLPLTSWSLKFVSPANITVADSGASCIFFKTILN